ncbi:hypothetical protein EDB81DRAFT_154099 [Dactylonectria macrodidyma]|uniref:Uncharacterized protein n=1 Tax=Dactylonectria macrodidyma TaxID=307937 RepID=A0A9P9FPS2_9HYPO|nr:hypothetical protein EDB81DRAFT_154099 [Dactylonectria macrodidyma]
MNKFLLFTLSATSALAASSPLLIARTFYDVSCSDQGQKDCGSGCIDVTYTCCPSEAGGCPATATCVLGSNGEYGCCDNGDDCEGDGGVNTEYSTETVTVPAESAVETPAETPAETAAEPPADESAIETPVETAAEPPVESAIETPAGTPTAIPAEEPTSEVVVSYTNVETLQTEIQTEVPPLIITTPGGVLPTPGPNNGTTPTGITTPTVIPSSGASFSVNIVGCLIACVVVLLF